MRYEPRAICDVCERKVYLSDLTNVRDPYNLQYGLSVCRRCLDKTNPQSYPFALYEKPFPNPELLRPPKPEVPVGYGTSERLPSAPQNLIAFASGSDIALTWDGPESLGTAVITGYQIERSYGDSDPWTVLSSSAIMGYNDTQVAITEVCEYRVAAVTNFGLSAYSNIAYYPTSAVFDSTVALAASDTSDVLLTGDYESLLYVG